MPVLRGLLAGIGALIIAGAIGMELFSIGGAGFGPAQIVMLVGGTIYIATAMFVGRMGEKGLGLSAMMLMGGGLLGTLELAGHVIDYDFDHTFEAWTATPIYYRQPIEPIGDAFFRRPGPESWTGQVLATQLKRVNAAEQDAYADEPTRTYEYDLLGFRNPRELQDWDVVFVGDSFTELGYLPHEELVSSLVGKELGVPVKNLGCSYTGTLTHNFYLREYGKSPGTRRAILVFFEGNDIKDALLEQDRLDAFRTNNIREYRDLGSQRQTSFLRASVKVVQQAIAAKRGAITNENAKFPSADGEIPVTLLYSARNLDLMEPAAQQALKAGVEGWAATSRELGLEPWLVYMPVKHRVVHGLVHYLDSAGDELSNWQPSDLPEHVANVCDQHGINFIDSTPALIETAKNGQLPYNAIWDTHLNSLGTKVVADVIVERLRTETQTVQVPSEKNSTGG